MALEANSMVFAIPTSLDTDQISFVSEPRPNLRLLAPAGSGKTLCLLLRCLQLCESEDGGGARFLVFTFTRAARDELRLRIARDPRLAPLGPCTTVTTLNAWGYRRLRASQRSVKLITSSAQRHMCVNNTLRPVWLKYPALQELLEDSRQRTQASRDLLELIDQCKSLGFRHDLMTTGEDIAKHIMWLGQHGMRAHVQKMLHNIFAMGLLDRRMSMKPDQVGDALMGSLFSFWIQACEHLHASAFATFADQKYWPLLDLSEQVESGLTLSGAARYSHILVDEFQDINPLDLALIRAIATVNQAAVVVVGDDDQAIYEWRGATPEFILHPERHFACDFETHVLGTNYRSPRNIVAISQQLIKNNRRRVPKTMRAASHEDAVVDVSTFPRPAVAIDHVVNKVRELLDSGECRNVALVSRKRGQIIPYQIVFASERLPFYAAEDLQVFLSGAFDELKTLLLIRHRAARDVFEGADPIRDLIQLCDKMKRYPLSKRDRGQLLRYLQKESPDTLLDATKCLRDYTGYLKGDNSDGSRSNQFATSIMAFLRAPTLSDAIGTIGEVFGGMQKDYGKSLDDIFYADPPFLYLQEYAERYGNDTRSLVRDIDMAVATLAHLPSEADAEADEGILLPIHLMTALRAKGKEFDAVFVLDANDGIWPNHLAKSQEQIEQERRIFYVAVTRARKYLSFIVNEEILNAPVMPSPYLYEMNLIS